MDKRMDGNGTKGQTDLSVTDRRTEGRTEGWKDGQTLFYRTLLATAGGSIINIFIIEQIQWKLMTNFSFNLKKKLFLAHFPNFWGIKSFSKNQVVMHNFIRFVLYWTCYLEQNSRNFLRKPEIWILSNYYLDDLSNPNLWNVGGFDYALAIIKNIFLFIKQIFLNLFFLCPVSLWLKTTKKIRLFACFVLSLPYYFSSLQYCYYYQHFLFAVF